jgi:hypothetical protein
LIFLIQVFVFPFQQFAVFLHLEYKLKLLFNSLLES